MKIIKLNRGESQKAMNEWIEMCPNLPKVDEGYALVRNDIISLFDGAVSDLDKTGLKMQDYYVDARFGIALYMYLIRQPWFNLRLAADDGFWRYLSVVVVPNIVSQRWGKDNSDHFWKIPIRIWLKQIWWYVYLSWNDDEESTRTILESKNCSTDTILNFVERSGKKGTCIEAYRKIIKIYSQIPPDKLSDFNRGRKSDDLFRVVMKLNTARMLVVEPELCTGGSRGYALKLFQDAGFAV